MARQMSNQEKPRDVSGVELLMNNHQGLKAEIDAREENFAITVNLGKDLIMRKHEKTPEVRDRLLQLATLRGGMMEQWEQTWEHLQLMLEVYQFARDATVAEAWLVTHESYLNNPDCGQTLDAVETLLKKHEEFERSAATQDERFAALERLTTLELRQRQKTQQEEYERQHPGSIPKPRTYADKYIEDFLPPPEPEPEPEPVPVVVQEVQAEVKPAKEEDIQDAGLQRMREHSPEEGPARETPGTSADPQAVSFEGPLSRKHEWESTTKKASNRSWEKVYVVLSNSSLLFYKDQKHAKAEPKTLYRSEVELAGATAATATDYNKRPNVFRVKLASGGDYLFQTKDEDEMNRWIDRIKVASGDESAHSLSRAQTMPASSDDRRDEPKKRSFFTLGKKK